MTVETSEGRRRRRLPDRSSGAMPHLRDEERTMRVSDEILIQPDMPNITKKQKAQRKPRATIGHAAIKLVSAVKGNRYDNAIRCAEVLAFALERDGDPDSAAAIHEAIANNNARQMFAIALNAPGDWWKPGDPLEPIVLEGGTRAAFDRLLVELEAAPRFVAAGIDAPTRVFFEGPSGVGKTLAAKHVADRLGLPLLMGRLDQMIDSHMGESSKRLAKLFESAKGAPCVLFLDEIDALIGGRGDKSDGAAAEAGRTTSSLLQQLDALPPAQIVIAASNFPDAIDGAVYRRIPTRLMFDPPGLEARKQMLRGWWSKVPIGPERINDLAFETAGKSGADLRSLAMAEAREVILRG